MMIANPIYDVVFKFLMDDDKVARFLVSRILGKEVLELAPRPQEVVADIARKSLTVYRLDYAARLRLEDGSEQLVLIEIQKAKYHTDILRFRRYLAEQYASEANVRTKGLDALGREQSEPLPIVSIYFLGHKLDTLTNPVIAVQRTYRDAITGEELSGHEMFVESLTHDSYVIQIPYLTQRRRNDLETLLSIFDQHSRSHNHHILNVVPEDFPEKFQAVIRRLQRAQCEPEVRKVMSLEDDVLEELQANERALERQKKILEEQEGKLSEQEGKLIKQEEILATQEEKLFEQEEKLVEQEERLAQQERQLADAQDALRHAALAMRAAGVDEAAIAALGIRP